MTAALDNLATEALPEPLRETLEFFESIVVISAGASYRNFVRRIHEDEEFRQHVVKVLCSADTDVCNLSTEAEVIEGDEFSELTDELGDVELPLRNSMSIKFGQGEHTITSLFSEHRTSHGLKHKLRFSEESDGTQRLAHLAPALTSRTPSIYVVDELDRSLHPLLSRRLLELFLEHCKISGSQLMATAHDTTLLTQEFLRRDEIWFVEKKRPELASILYSLSDFKVRKDRRLNRGYLAGRFGAIPQFDELGIQNGSDDGKASDGATQEAG